MQNNFLTKIKENCNIQTILVAIALSAFICVGAILGFNFLIILALNGKSVYPKEFPLSVIGAVIAFIAVIVLLVLYFRFRKAKPSGLSAVIDFVAFILTIPLFYSATLWFVNKIS